MEKFKWLIDRINRERKRTRNAKSSMRIVWFYGVGLALISALLVVGWVYQWMLTGHPDLPLLVSYFKEYTAASVVAAVTFLSVFNVDKNNDGRPDAAELQSKQPKDPPKVQFPSVPKKEVTHD